MPVGNGADPLVLHTHTHTRARLGNTSICYNNTEQDIGEERLS